MIITTIAVVLAIIGAAFLVLAAIGIVRLPDLYCRASATTKAATLGVGCILVSSAMHFDDMQVTSRVLATVAFLLLTAPVAAHVIARAAYRTGVPMWHGTFRDELRDAVAAQDNNANAAIDA